MSQNNYDFDPTDPYADPFRRSSSGGAAGGGGTKRVPFAFSVKPDTAQLVMCLTDSPIRLPLHKVGYAFQKLGFSGATDGFVACPKMIPPAGKDKVDDYCPICETRINKDGKLDPDGAPRRPQTTMLVPVLVLGTLARMDDLGRGVLPDVSNGKEYQFGTRLALMSITSKDAKGNWVPGGDFKLFMTARAEKWGGSALGGIFVAKRSGKQTSSCGTDWSVKDLLSIQEEGVSPWLKGIDKSTNYRLRYSTPEDGLVALKKLVADNPHIFGDYAKCEARMKYTSLAPFTAADLPIYSGLELEQRYGMAQRLAEVLGVGSLKDKIKQTAAGGEGGGAVDGDDDIPF